MSCPGVWSLAWSLRTCGLTCSVYVWSQEDGSQLLRGLDGAALGLGPDLTTEAGKTRLMILTLREQGPRQRSPALGRPRSGNPVSLASPPHLFA